MKKVLLYIMLCFSIIFVSCKNNSSVKEYQEPNLSDSSTNNGSGEILLSNISDKKSMQEVESILKAYLRSENVDRFLKGVQEYNDTIENTGLNGEFKTQMQPEYDLEEIEKLWASKNGDFIGTNCRLNTFMLLESDIEIEKANKDDSLLFLDNNSIEYGNVLDAEEADKFRILFSKVKTEATKDIRIHAKKMQEHFKNIRFNEDAKMVSLIIHDNLDGDYLFVGHVGVLVKSEDKYLFVEKLSFEEPFQAIKFDSPEDCYDYLYLKYKHYHDDTTAKPFIMENNKLIELDLYNK